jgi:hypothetical protein
VDNLLDNWKIIFGKLNSILLKLHQISEALSKSNLQVRTIALTGRVCMCAFDKLGRAGGSLRFMLLDLLNTPRLFPYVIYILHHIKKYVTLYSSHSTSSRMYSSLMCILFVPNMCCHKKILQSFSKNLISRQKK